jgi:hypothetical protein
MWLDRLASSSGASSPQPASRPYSPAPPRRSASNSLSPYVTSQRAGHSPRASSLSLVSNDSTASLLSSSRKPNGSSLRRTVSAGPEAADPFDLLNKLLSATFGEDGDLAGKGSAITEADLDLKADFGGLTLKELASSPRQGPGAVTTRRPQTTEEFEKERTKFEDLHRSIVACDDILNSVETNLTSFRNDLAAVSADIESLQARSTALNRRLENRKDVEKALGPLVEELSIPPETISKIAEGPIDESWARLLSEVEKRHAVYQKRSGESQDSKAFEDIGPLLDKLILKAIQRIRDFLVAQIKALRSPNINAQIIQQQNFLRFKSLFAFLHHHHATLAEEIAQAYVNTMRWYYLNQFGRYEKSLGKIKIHALDRNDVLGSDDATRKARPAGPPHDAFNLGRRVDILKTKSRAALSSYLAEEDQATHYLETPFRNFNLALIDNATAEYTFLAAFFSPALPLSRISKYFNHVFEPTFELGHVLSKTLTGESFDALGLLLCIRLNQHFAFELQRRRVPAVDGYINGTNMLLWPRLQLIMDRHYESVRQLATSAKRPADQARMTAAPHVATQRFGQLLHGFLALSAEAGDDEPVVASLRRLRAEVEAFLDRQSQAYGSDKRKAQRFLYNNYSLICTIIGDVDGKLAAEQQAHFEELKKKYQE